ncbi:unnamed protein product [Owenia fusiformis]|uniref:Fe2OG dioxygenase domain-containing protein n=1 Tax=Owenia fusiformis TaxID=6347 RepID=A0A8S4Q7T8_OWEFU|nr:unnamed protein product [Owenia fusiformis]
MRVVPRAHNTYYLHPRQFILDYTQYGLHVTYHNEEQFIEDYGQILHQKGCRATEQLNAVIVKIYNEIDRRKNLGKAALERIAIIKSSYKPLHEDVYTLKEKYLSNEFLKLVRHCKATGSTEHTVKQFMNTEKAESVFSMQVFTMDFCKVFIEEMEHFEKFDFPKGRPNTMNNYGILLNELGFDENFMKIFRSNYIEPIAKLLYPECTGTSLDTHKAFIVKYKPEEDTSLSFHYDNAEVTLNINLGKDFQDGQLYFGKMRQHNTETQKYSIIKNKPTIGILHRGQHMHGALPISDGERYNLIIWMRSSKVRNELCPMCDRKPELLHCEGRHDGFTSSSYPDVKTVDVCSTS